MAYRSPRTPAEVVATHHVCVCVCVCVCVAAGKRERVREMRVLFFFFRSWVLGSGLRAGLRAKAKSWGQGLHRGVGG